MSIADNFLHTPDAGFARADHAQDARRQFRLSLGLVAVLAVSALFASISGLRPVQQSAVAIPSVQTSR